MSDEDQNYQIQLLNKILERQECAADAIQNLDKRMDLHIQQMSYELKEIKELDAKQNEILTEHHQRSNELKRDNELREQALKQDIHKVERRIEKLEIPRKWFSWTFAFIKWVGGPIGTIYALGKFFHWF